MHIARTELYRLGLCGYGKIHKTYTLWGKKLHHFIFAKNFLKTFCNEIINGTYILQLIWNKIIIIIIIIIIIFSVA